MCSYPSAQKDLIQSEHIMSELLVCSPSIGPYFHRSGTNIQFTSLLGKCLQDLLQVYTYLCTVFTVCTVGMYCMYCVHCVYCMYFMFCMYCVYHVYCVYCMYCTSLPTISYSFILQLPSLQGGHSCMLTAHTHSLLYSTTCCYLHSLLLRMLLAECSAGLGEWSDVHEVLRDVGAQVDEVFTLEHIKPLMIRMYIGQGDLVHASEVCVCVCVCVCVLCVCVCVCVSVPVCATVLSERV